MSRSKVDLEALQTAPTRHYLFRDVNGRLLAGAGTDIRGRWSWWARSTQGRRVVVASEAEAVQAARAASKSATAPL